jgi:DNA polymerase V
VCQFWITIYDPFLLFLKIVTYFKGMTRGGKRNGAGRPQGSNLYGEKTRPIRIPISQVDRVLRFVRERENQLPLYACGVSAGFPSPADDYLEGSLDLNAHLVREPNATFFVRANGESMIGAGIHDGDLLVVDRSARVSDGKVVIVALNGELTVKRFRKEKGKSWLMPENKKFKPILLSEEDDTHLWGVVTSVIHSL